MKTLSQNVYADKAQGGAIWKNLHCQKQNRKRYAGGLDRRGQIIHRKPLSNRPLNVQARKQVGHWVCDTDLRANIRALLSPWSSGKGGYAVIAKVANKTLN
jgi:transposase, IS30 family